MAKKKISDVLIRFKGDNKDLDKSIGGSNQKLRGFASSAVSSLAKIGVAFGAVAVAVSAYSIKQAMTFEGLDRAFKRMVTDQGYNADEFITQLKEMSKGTVNEMEIMKRANMGLLLGLKPDALITFMEAATTIAQATGESTGYMFESLVTGTARQSKLWLDNLGILIDVDAANKAYANTLGIEANALTEAQRKQAFVNAAIKESSKKTVELGGFVLDTKAKWDQLITSFKDASVTLGQQLMPEFDKILTWIMDNKDWMVTTFDDIFDIEVANFGDSTVEQLDKVKNWIDANKGDIEWWVDSIKRIFEWRAERKAAAAAFAAERPSARHRTLGVAIKETVTSPAATSINIVLDPLAVEKFLAGGVINVTKSAVLSGT